MFLFKKKINLLFLNKLLIFPFIIKYILKIHLN